MLLFVFRFGERVVRLGFSFERNVRRRTADSAARSERGGAGKKRKSPAFGECRASLSYQDSNLEKQDQNLLCYRYTIAQ